MSPIRVLAETELNARKAGEHQEREFCFSVALGSAKKLRTT